MNKRLIIIMGIVSALLVGCEQQMQSEQEYIEQAKDLVDKGMYRDAIVQLKNAIKVNPSGPEGRYLLGMVYLEVGDGAAAEKELLKAQELGVVTESISFKLLQAYLLEKKYKEIIESSAQGGDIDAIKGLAYLEMRDQAMAKKMIENAMTIVPQSPYVIVANAKMNIAMGRLDQAKKDIDGALLKKPDDAHAWSVMGDIRRLEGDGDGAIDAYSKAIAGRSDNAVDLMQRALLLITKKNFDQAQKDVDTLKARFPAYSGTNYVQGVLYFYQERLPEAQAAFEQLMAINGDDVWGAYYLGALHFLQGRQAQAGEYLGRVVKAEPNFVPARKLLAMVKLKDQKFKEAEELVAPIVKAMPDDVFSWNVLANALVNQKRTKEAVIALEKVAELQPGSAGAKMRLGLGLINAGESGPGFMNLESAIEIDPKFEDADVFLVLGYLDQGQVEKALQAARKFIAKRPDGATAQALLGRVLLAKQDQQGAVVAFEAARKLEAGHVESSTQLAVLAQKQGDIEKARGYYQSILKSHPDHLQTLINMASLEAQAGDKARVNELLQKAVKSHADVVQPRVLLVREYMKERKFDQARAVLTDMPDKLKNDAAMLAVTAELQLASGQYSDAKVSLKKLLELQPEQAEVRYFMSQALLGLGDVKGARSELEKAVSMASADVRMRIALAKLLLGSGDFRAAQNQLVSLKKAGHGGRLDVRVIEADIFAATGKEMEALNGYQAIFKEAPSDDALIKVSRQMWRTGKKIESMAMLSDWLKREPNNLNVLLEQANGYIGLERSADAMVVYKKVLSISADNPIALNNLAWYYRNSDQSQALSYAEKAYQSAPNSASISDTYAAILIDKKDYVRAADVIKRGLIKNPNDPALQYREIQMLDAQGEAQQARQKLAALLARNVKFEERKAAEEMFKRLGG